MKRVRRRLGPVIVGRRQHIDLTYDVRTAFRYGDGLQKCDVRRVGPTRISGGAVLDGDDRRAVAIDERETRHGVTPEPYAFAVVTKMTHERSAVAKRTHVGVEFTGFEPQHDAPDVGRAVGRRYDVENHAFMIWKRSRSAGDVTETDVVSMPQSVHDVVPVRMRRSDMVLRQRFVSGCDRRIVGDVRQHDADIDDVRHVESGTM